MYNQGGEKSVMIAMLFFILIIYSLASGHYLISGQELERGVISALMFLFFNIFVIYLPLFTAKLLNLKEVPPGLGSIKEYEINMKRIWSSVTSIMLLYYLLLIVAEHTLLFREFGIDYFYLENGETDILTTLAIAVIIWLLGFILVYGKKVKKIKIF